MKSPEAGPGIIVTGGRSNDVISLAPDFRRHQFFPAIITEATADGDNRWSYEIDEVTKTDAGYGEWTTRVGGRSGTARNIYEDMNAATGIQGNGIDIANLPDGFEIKPAPVDLIVHVTRVVEATTGTLEYWFAHVNAVDGECDSGGGSFDPDFGVIT